MEQSIPENFEQLPLARTGIALAQACQYRIYTDAKNFTRVEADSAVSALELSGLSNVIKIERESLHKNTLITPNLRQVDSEPPSSPQN